ncbi:MAG TPA: hypothetical protein VGN77_04600 [Steroidobacteraceae bacterium]|nr:hypothetical protein [Steroidobacteraceae bacterium]
MSDYKDPAPELRANRRKEVFRAVRGNKLTGQRGRWSGELAQLSAAGSKKMPAEDDELKLVRRVRLGSVIEDEAADAEARDRRRYSEPND